MSCNPAIGGIGKGHLTKEIDALGGAMATAIDKAGIQFRTLNASKGPAVRATRAQADRELYRHAIRRLLESQPGLSMVERSVDDLILEGDRVAGVVTAEGRRFRARAVVLTVGTFLGGRILVGHDEEAGGRVGDAPSIRLAERLRELPFRVARLKTGTPPRLDGKTLNFDAMLEQPGDEPTPVFSFSAGVAITRGRYRASSRRRPRKRTTSFAVRLTSRRCIRAPLMASGRAIAHRWKTRSCALPTRRRTRSLSSPRA